MVSQKKAITVRTDDTARSTRVMIRMGRRLTTRSRIAQPQAARTASAAMTRSQG